MAELTPQQSAEYNYNVIRALLISQGMPDIAATFAAAQVLFETNGLTSNVSKADNNLSGILFINKPYQVATKGVARPRSEGGNYAHFDSVRAWAKDFVRILKLGKEKPINAITLEDFVRRLKQNGYFASSEQNYYKGVATWLQRIRQSIPKNGGVTVDENNQIVQQRPYNITNPADVNNRGFVESVAEEFFPGSSDAGKYLKWGLGLLAVIAVINLVRR